MLFRSPKPMLASLPFLLCSRTSATRIKNRSRKVSCQPRASPIRILPEQDAVSNLVFNSPALFLKLFSNFPQIRHKFPTNSPQISQNCPTRLPYMSPTNSPQIFTLDFLTKPVLGGPRKICGETFCWSLGNLWAAPGTHLWAASCAPSNRHQPHTSAAYSFL